MTRNRLFHGSAIPPPEDVSKAWERRSDRAVRWLSYGAVMSPLSWLLEDFVDRLGEALLALLFDLGGIVAGALLYAYLSSAGGAVPFVLLLYPGY